MRTLNRTPDAPPLLNALPGVRRSAFARIPWLSALLVFAIVWLWVLPIRSSLWCDEAGTFWMARGDLLSTVRRCLDWPGQSPLYGSLAWLSLALGGRNEIALRLPSLLAMLLAAYYLFRLSVRHLGRDAALLALVIFVTSRQVIFSACDGRPSAAAVLATVLAMLLLLRWFREDRWRYGIGFAIAAALAIHLHYLFATMLPVYAVSLFEYQRQAPTKSGWRRAAPGALLALLLLPLIPQLLTLARQRAIFSATSHPDLYHLAEALVPPLLSISVLGAFLSICVFQPGTVAFRPDLARPPLYALIAWAVLPVLTLYLVAVFSASRVFLPRYYLAAAPGFSLLCGWILSQIRPNVARSAVAYAILLLALLTNGGWLTLDRQHTSENWRAALAKVREITRRTPMPVLMTSYLVESNSLDWQNPAAAANSRLFAPLSPYPILYTPIALPYRLDDEAKLRLESLLAARLRSERQFLLVTNQTPDPYAQWLSARLVPERFSASALGNYGAVHVYRFSQPGVPFNPVEK